MTLADLRTFGEPRTIQTDLCIVGSGPAGASIAKEFAGSTVRVLLIEAGGMEQTDDNQALCDFENVGVHRYPPQENPRNRMLGGSSYSWGGRCAALNDIDFEHRTWVPDAGWPIGPQDVAPFLDRAGAHLGNGPNVYDDHLWKQLGAEPPRPPIDPVRLKSQFWQISRDASNASEPTRFSRTVAAMDEPNINVLTHANLTHINTNADGTRVESLEVSTLAGQRFEIEAKCVVLACGGIENARLLLASNRIVPNGVGNANDIVGRFLMDHPRCTLGWFQPDRSDAVQDRFGGYLLDDETGRHSYPYGLALSPEVQRNEQLLNCAAFISTLPSADDPWSAMKGLLRRLRPGSAAPESDGAGSSGKQFATVIRHMPELLNNAYRRAVKRRTSIIRAEEIVLSCWTEQAPDASSRVTLAERTDALGMRISRIDWRLGELERRSVLRLSELVGLELRRIGLPEHSPNTGLSNDIGWRSCFIDSAHPMGTTRMSDSPRRGVVDRNCQVHGVAGLYIAGSSVFSTSGHSNPTLMIVTLAVRLADWLKQNEFQSGSSGDRLQAPLRDGAFSQFAYKRPHKDFSELTMKPVYDPPSAPDGELPRLPGGSKVLVTGATGFIGGRLVERLQQQGIQVRCIVRDIAGAARLGRLPVELVQADLRNAAEINRAVENIDYVFHCAYDWHSRRQNIDGLHNLVEACATHPVKRLVHVSTFSVYENLQDGPITEEVRDGDRANTYVDTKLDLEGIIFDAVRTRQLAATIVQPTIVYGAFCGPWTNTPAEKLIYGEVILQDGDQGLCNAVYVDDVVDGLLLAAVSPAAVGERFIVSGPRPVTWAAFYTEMARALGTRPPQFWSRERIAKSYQENRPGRLAGILALPKRVVRKVMRVGLDALPAALRKIVPGRSSAGSHARGGIFLPEPWYSWTASAGSEKARLKLGYSPRFDLQRGMELTGHYLRWAYGDIVRSGQPELAASPDKESQAPHSAS